MHTFLLNEIEECKFRGLLSRKSRSRSYQPHIKPGISHSISAASIVSFSLDPFGGLNQPECHLETSKSFVPSQPVRTDEIH